MVRMEDPTTGCLATDEMQVAAQLRDLHVPFYPSSRYTTQRMQETLLHPTTAQQGPQRAKEYEAAGCAAI